MTSSHSRPETNHFILRPVSVRNIFEVSRPLYINKTREIYSRLPQGWLLQHTRAFYADTLVSRVYYNLPSQPPGAEWYPGFLGQVFSAIKQYNLLLCCRDLPEYR